MDPLVALILGVFIGLGIGVVVIILIREDMQHTRKPKN